MSNLLLPKQTEIVPAREDYRSSDIREGFDWPTIIRDFEQDRGINLRTGSKVLHLWEFGSIVRPDVDPRRIEEADDAAYDAVRSSPNLLAYFRGTKNEHGEWAARDKNGFSLSFCVWDDYTAAFNAVHGPSAEKHRHAAGQADDFYEQWYLETRTIVPSDDSVIIIDHNNPHSRKSKGFIHHA